MFNIFRHTAITMILFAAAVVGFVATASAQDDDATIKVDASIVTANVTVTNKDGAPVEGLRRDLFKIFVDGKERNIESFVPESNPFAAAILIDVSGSMESRLQLARGAAIQFLFGMRNTDVSTILSFDSKVKVVQEFSADRGLPDRFYDLSARGETALNDAVFRSAQLLSSRPEKRRAIVVISDGGDNASRRSTDKAIRAATLAEATIYTVNMAPDASAGLPNRQDQAALKRMAERTGGTFISTPGGVAMREQFKKIVNELSSQYTLSFEAPETERDGKFHTIEVRIARPGLTVRTRKGYIAKKAD